MNNYEKWKLRSLKRQKEIYQEVWIEWLERDIEIIREHESERLNQLLNTVYNFKKILNQKKHGRKN